MLLSDQRDEGTFLADCHQGDARGVVSVAESLTVHGDGGAALGREGQLRGVKGDAAEGLVVVVILRHQQHGALVRCHHKRTGIEAVSVGSDLCEEIVLRVGGGVGLASRDNLVHRTCLGVGRIS